MRSLLLCLAAVVAPLVHAEEPLWTAPKQTVLIPWRTWTAEEISMHLRSPAMEKELKQGVPPIIQATDLANELENRDVDGQALDKLLEGQGANLCRNLEALALGKNRGRRCVELVSAVRRSFGEGGDPEVKTESRWRWYWPFYSDFKNYAFWILGTFTVVTFLLDQWYTFQLRRKGYKVDFTKEAKKKRDELRDKYYGFEPIKGLKKKQPSRADNIHALTQVTRAALDRNSEPAQDGEGLRQRIGGASVPPELAETELTGEVTKKSE